jgi:hypothetical protein
MPAVCFKNCRRFQVCVFIIIQMWRRLPACWSTVPPAPRRSLGTFENALGVQPLGCHSQKHAKAWTPNRSSSRAKRISKHVLRGMPPAPRRERPRHARPQSRAIGRPAVCPKRKPERSNIFAKQSICHGGCPSHASLSQIPARRNAGIAKTLVISAVQP